MIEARLGEEGFFNFMQPDLRQVSVSHLASPDFQHELEAFTGASWEQFFEDWLYGKGITDWAVKNAEVGCGPERRAGSCRS